MAYPVIRFGDVVHLNTDRIADPLTAGVERYVGLEHITPEDLHIHSWGLVADGTTFTNAFKPGQVLFGKRRAYQRKVAVADFSGVCSGDIYVFETRNPDVLLPELLPFICQTEGFYEHAVGTSAGSLSPRTNWNQLADYEFPLPPLEEQHRIVKLLQAVENSRIVLQELLKTENVLLDSLVDLHCWQNNAAESQPLISLVKDTTGQVLDGDWIESKDMSLSGVRLIQLADIGIGSFLNRSDRYISEETFTSLGCKEVMPGDILISRMADPTGRTCIVPNLGIKMITAVDCSIVRLNCDLQNPDYWLFVFNSKTWFNKVQKFTSGSTRTRISRTNLESILIPIPDKMEQDRIVAELGNVSQGIVETTAYLQSLFALKKRLLVELLF